ncbi:hypothetical protein [Microbispora sp. KK1-11]|uniref:hypothetical protein n=1 Tax=Microbispora sp. KK1-11 TaxID=2053005 RepID=UPI001168C459|nr:hypothetical protein [Microbispora sp. KK1-11]TQS25263.1 hypothetical protein FLW16_31330 [Microbispora sp. KK1-11]
MLSPSQVWAQEHQIYSLDRVATSSLRLHVGPSVLAKTAIPATTLLILLYLAISALTLVQSSTFQEALHGPVLCEYIPDAPPRRQEEIRNYLGCEASSALVLFAGVAAIGLVPVFAMTYLSVRVLRFRADLFGTVLVIQGALKSKRFGLSTAYVRLDATSGRRIPYLQIVESASASGRLYLRDVHTPLMPAGDLLAVAEAIESGRRPEPFAGQAIQTAMALRRLASDPLARSSA